ncbi:uncharacterized protein FRV6_07034 [Fusarium oxysporum]|uniref:Uncharacterized protein n=2 Tax=Fusarium oxysporum TaxID=5507 RepID=A0A2H3T328_FUSOX|nr:uncharacterized protein FRV6_07034 [Fusarium oxysporum]
MDNTSVSFDPENMYTSQTNGDTKRLVIANYTVAQAPANATNASVVNGWHTSKSDPEEHCTVDYRCNGKNKRRHVYDADGTNKGIARMYGARKVHVWFSGALRCMG